MSIRLKEIKVVVLAILIVFGVVTVCGCIGVNDIHSNNQKIINNSTNDTNNSDNVNSAQKKDNSKSSSKDNSKNSSNNTSSEKKPPTYEEMKKEANDKGDNGFNYEDYKENVKNWDPNGENVG
jgi:hypothetical protein